jgi:hypothetical protein
MAHRGKEIRKLRKALEPQNVRFKPTKNGYLLLFPNGDTACIHYTYSDRMALMALRATVRRANIEWPAGLL